MEKKIEPKPLLRGRIPVRPRECSGCSCLWTVERLRHAPQRSCRRNRVTGAAKDSKKHVILEKQVTNWTNRFPFQLPVVPIW